MEASKMKPGFVQHIFIRRMLLMVLSGWLMCGCAKETSFEYVKKPKHLLSKEKMVSFLIDLHLAEAKMSYISVKNSDSTEILFRNYEQYLFEKHHIDDSTYYKSYQYYLAHMDQLDEIYAAVVDSLNVLNSLEKSRSLNPGTR